MKSYQEFTKEEMAVELEQLRARYKEEQDKGLNLSMARGNPCAEQLDLSMDMLRIPAEELEKAENGLDVRTYSTPAVLAGLPEARKMFADLLEVKPENVIVGGQSSLTLMYDAAMKAYVFGVYGGSKPWGRQEKLKWLCPAPGYDRHFRVTERLGFELITVPMTAEGPDMDAVRQYAENDLSVKGIWCVPKYSNPGGVVYSDRTVETLAALKPAADDFRIFWDNAYLIHGFREEDDRLMNIFEACRKYGSEDMVYEFASTSKMTFPGAGVAVIAASENNIEFLLKQIGAQSICFDKINQLRHVKFFGSANGMKEHMKKHAEFVRPRFEVTLKTLEENLGGLGIGEWSSPNGGYFISYDGLPGTAKRCFELCRDAGVQMTGAGATFPYGIDPENRNIRIAPTFPPVDKLQQSIRIFTLCQRIAALEKLIAG